MSARRRPARRSSSVVGGAAALVITLAAGACGGGRNPLALSPEAQLNFHTASIGLANWPRLSIGQGNDFLYIDQFDTTRTDIPYFVNAFDSYPVDLNAGWGILPFERIEYMREGAGAHRVRIANPPHGVVIDTTLTLGASASTVLYVTDSLETHYHVVAVDESTPGPADRVRLRVLNLSPDAGPVSTYVVASSGARLWSTLPQGVAYGTISPYVTVDTSIVASDGNVYLKFFGGTDTAQTVAAATVPVKPGRSYHVVVEGLVVRHVFTYPSPTAPGQTVSVTVNPSVTGHVRVAY